MNHLMEVKNWSKVEKAETIKQFQSLAGENNFPNLLVFSLNEFHCPICFASKIFSVGFPKNVGF
jgi:hypothetical protein